AARRLRPFQHPYYWAGFILVGDPGDVSAPLPEPAGEATEPTPGPPPSWRLAAGLGGFVLGVALRFAAVPHLRRPRAAWPAPRSPTGTGRSTGRSPVTPVDQAGRLPRRRRGPLSAVLRGGPCPRADGWECPRPTPRSGAT